MIDLTCMVIVWYNNITGVYFEVNGVIYPNNSVVSLSHIGTDSNALHCYTNKQGCCGTFGMRYGEFYYPNGTAVSIEGDKNDMYRNRGDQFIRLNRRILASDTASIAGRYRCEIPDEWGTMRKLYITLKWKTSGLSCTGIMNWQLNSLLFMHVIIKPVKCYLQ